MRIIGGYENTFANGEDFALTPYLFLVISKKVNVYGLGICWGHYAIFIGLGINVPMYIPSFINISKHRK